MNYICALCGYVYKPHKGDVEHGIDPETDYEDLPEIYEILKAPQVKKVVLLGESGHALAKKYHDSRFRVANSLSAAITAARLEAEAIATTDKPAIVLMSPAAASFDMFKNVYDRGDQYKLLIRSLAYSPAH